MANLDLASVTAALKEIYPDGLPEEMIYRASPFLAMLRKNTSDLRSKGVVIPFRYTAPQGASAVFATGRTNQTPSKYSRVVITWKNYYTFASIDGEVIDAAQGDPGAFIDALKSEIENAMYTMGRALARYQFGNGGGALGQISAGSTVGSTTITLANPSDVRWFEVGMVVKSSTTDGTSGAVKAGSVTLTAIDRAAGTLTASGNWSAGIGTVAVNDFLFRDGDFGAVLSGYEAWIPRVASGTLITSFFGLDRSPDSRMYGVRSDLSAMPIEEGVQTAAELLSRESAKPDFAVLSSVNWKNLALSLGSKVVYGEVKAYDNPQIGFPSIKVSGPTGMIDIISDPDAPVDRMLMGERDTWTVYSMGPLVKILDNDGNKVLRSVTSDAVELQLVSRANLGCTAPGHNGNFGI